VYCIGPNPNFNASLEGITRVKFRLMLSNVPTALSEQNEYFNALKQAIRSILSVSMEWNISISVDESARRLDLSSNFIVSIVFTSLFAGPGDIITLQSKLDSSAFLDQLNSIGFRASIANPPLTDSSNQVPSSLVVGLCSAAGGVIFLLLLLYLGYHFFGNARHKSRKDIKSRNLFEDSFVQCSLGIPREQLDKEGADKANAGSNGIISGKDQISEADYSKEFEDVLQLISRLAISIRCLVNPLLRKELEASVQQSDEITTHDCAAALQLISKIELDDNYLVHTSDRKELLQQRIREGPLTENHLLVLKLLCESEGQIHEKAMPMNVDIVPVASEVPSQQIVQCPSHSELEIAEDKASESCDKPLLDVLLLLKNCDLKPSYLVQKESRKLIEDNLTHRQEPLLAEHLAVLQLISKAEIDSNLSIDFVRKHLLEKRVKEGPLNADHLNAARSLLHVEREEMYDMTLGHKETVAEAGTRQYYAANLGSQAKHYEGCEVLNVLDDSVVSSGHDTLTQPSKALFFVDSISGLEVRSSLLSREEKSALQLMELRAKTARIRQSLPEWVRNGLVPPRRNPSPLAVVLAETIAHQASRDAVQISCNVQADLGFLNDFLPTAVQTKSKQGALEMESLFLGVEQHMDITSDVPQPVTMSGWQEEQLAADARLSPTPPSRIRTPLAWISSALAQCVSNCLQVVMGACLSGLGCLTCLLSRKQG
jgi:hypothetical protein